MALQGTIDSFPLVDVLALLESSRKTGRLELVGDRGRGVVWVQEGELVAAEVAETTEVGPADAIWELLRFSDGSFEFAAGDEPSQCRFAAEISSTVEAASRMLEQWERITEKVPGLGHGVSLAAELPGDEVRLSGDDWRVVAAAGPSLPVRDLLAALGVGEFAGCSKLAELVDRSLLVVEEPVAAAVSGSGTPAQADAQAAASTVGGGATPPDMDVPLSEQFPEPLPGQAPEALAPAGDPVSEMERGGADPGASQFPEHFPIDDLVGEGDGGGWEAAGHAHATAPLDPAVANPSAEATAPGAGHPAQPFGVENEPPAPAEPRVISEPQVFADSQPVAQPDAGAQSAPGGGNPADSAPLGGPLAAEQPSAGQVPFEPQTPGADPFAVNGTAEAQGGASEDVLSQISRLSPKAAEAIAAALGDEGGA